MSQEQNSTISGSVFDVYDTTSQKYKENRMPRVGQRVEFEDGRKFVFCSTAADLVAGQIAGCAAEGVEITSTAVAATAGTRKISVVLASQAVNAYAGGYISLTQGGANNQTYKVKSSTASATVLAVADTIILTLYDSLAVAVVADDNVILKKTRFAALIQGTALLDNVGVAVRSTTAATSGNTNYFWVQTSGVGTTVGTAGAADAALMAAAAGAAVAQTAGNAIVATGIEAGAVTSMCNLCFPE